MIEERQVLNFIPPQLDGIDRNTDRRYMVITNNSNILEMINISKVQGKERKMFIIGNKRLKNFSPFKIPSFAKTDTVYQIEYFPEIERFVSFDGRKKSKEEFTDIIQERKKYINKTGNIKIIKFIKEEFWNSNQLYSMQ